MLGLGNKNLNYADLLKEQVKVTGQKFRAGKV